MQVLEQAEIDAEDGTYKINVELAGGSGKATVAFFYITTNGAVNVRKSTDYIPKMIELAGGTFCLFCDLPARTLFAPTELSISTVTAVFSAPVVIIILLQKQKGRE